MNPYEPKVIEEFVAPESPQQNRQDRIGVGVLAFVTGSIHWTSLYLGLGFGVGSDFGNRLTILYGQDLQDANMDWWLLMVLLIAASLLLHVLAYRTVPLCCSARWAQPQTRTVVSVLTPLIGGVGLLTLVTAISAHVGSPSLPVIGVSIPGLLICEIVTFRCLRLH